MVRSHSSRRAGRGHDGLPSGSCRSLAKKLLCAALVGVLLLSALPLFVSAATDDDSPAAVKTCEYNAESKTLTVVGTLSRALLSEGTTHKLSLYLLPPGTPEDELLADENRQPLTAVNASLSFRMSASVSYADAVGSRFLITLTGDGEETVVCYPFRVDVKLTGKRPGGTKGSFKGIVSDAFRPEDSAEMTVVPVLLDTLLTESTGGIGYTVGETFTLFDKATVDALDAKIKFYRTTGTRVYLRLLCNGSPESLLPGLLPSVSELSDGYEYILPNLSTAENRLLYAATVSFLAERYGTDTGMDVSGFVLGDRVDLSTATANGDMTETALGEYLADAYSLTLTALALIRSDLFLSLSFSDSNPYGSGTAHLRGRYSPLALLSAVCAAVDAEYPNPTTVTMMIESEEMPVTAVTDASGNTRFALRTASNFLSIIRLQTLETALLRLARSYTCAPKTYTYVLGNGNGGTSERLSGDALCAAVTYAYYTGYSSRMMESLVFSLSADDYRTVRTLLRNVDTDRSEEVTAPFASVLGADSWEDITEVPDLSAKKHVRVTGATLPEIPDTVLGNYPYFDYAYHTGVGTWFGADGCTGVRIESDAERGRALTADLALSGSSASGEYADLVCAFEYPENFSHTPFLGITLTLDEPDDGLPAGDLYEVKVRLGKDRDDVSAAFVVHGGKSGSLILDLSDYTKKGLLCSYLSLSVRPLGENDRNVTLRLNSVIGYSEEYRTDELESVIAESRYKIRTADANSGKPTVGELTVIIAVVAAVLAIVALGVVLILRKEKAERLEAERKE